VNAVLPAEVLTPQYESWVEKQSNPQATLKHISGQIPLENRMTTAAEIAAAVVFLLSSTHSGHTTAQHIIVDGGYVHLDRMLTAKG
jgi:L-fucose dehydrogenase